MFEVWKRTVVGWKLNKKFCIDVAFYHYFIRSICLCEFKYYYSLFGLTKRVKVNKKIGIAYFVFVKLLFVIRKHKSQSNNVFLKLHTR